ncbi:MAG TPA: NAD(P)-dependent oxidoreductase [Ramlibacter sp.]|uniref:NAD(P)-dependent oxidoreductase n=1 Tax=Ramlibacter sp. TaxID=1917967 RepID=UPI002BEFD37F|nr:NAD(P)-dependent oxidoreductase [Ramlibacter sp.]HVZ45242.1 NAD(P)-dependent oxidoreductase [Ramlibacter sp.]
MTAARSGMAVGLVGLGAMGAPMARNILKAGLPLVVYDIDAAKCEALRALGATVAASSSDLAGQAARIICMVETTAQARAVVTGAGGLAEGAVPGHRIACMSTIAPRDIREMQVELAARQVGFIDAPVSGGTERAIAGSLSIFASGEDAVIDAFEDVFAAVGKTVFRLGAIGQGTIVKLINNMLMQVNAVAVAEGMAMGMKAGIDPQMLHEIVKASTGYSVAWEMRAPRMIARNFAPGGTMDISYKDQELETALAKQLGVPVFLAAVSQQVYQMGRNMGYAKEDGSALIKVYEQLGNIAS